MPSELVIFDTYVFVASKDLRVITAATWACEKTVVM
jgi:hypothetical protein